MRIINWFNENEGFVLAILTAATETQGGDSNERLLDKRDNFVTKFEETLKLENKLEELLKIEMKKSNKVCKRKEKQK